jgi:hypothetical protein
MHITTNVGSSNPAQARCTRYNIMWESLSVTCRFSPGPPVSSNNKTDCHDITEILLKVALNTINQPSKEGSVATIIKFIFKSFVKIL